MMKKLFEVMRVYGLVVGAAASLWAQAPLITAEGFAVPQAGKTFSFPRDHGAHPDFKLEWWYVTGHLFKEGAEGAGGRRLGFQATFFRQAAPDKSVQLHLAHMAIIDVATGRFLHQERLNRAGWDAGSAEETLEVRQGNWSLRLSDPAAAAGAERMELRGGVQAEAALALTLTPVKPLVVFGENSISRKGAAPTTEKVVVELGVDGSKGFDLYGDLTPRNGEPLDKCIRMNGNVVYRFATQVIVESAKRVLEAGGYTQDDIDLFVPHQANLRIIESGVERLGFPSERVVVTLDQYGNTSSASIPLCLDYAWRTGRLQPGQRLLMMGLGGGLAWGTCLIRWMGEPA